MLKFLLGLALLVAVAWFGSTVTLGSHTLFGHLQAISHTKESQDLLEGTKQSAKPLVDDVRRRIAGAPDPEAKTAEHAAAESPVNAPPDAGPPQEKLSSADRQKLRHLLGSAERTGARQ
ncbi:MAG TPA: hypothetical protein VGL59_03280 [Polyangia bacterium]|jgi:hypothetical protein